MHFHSSTTADMSESKATKPELNVTEHRVCTDCANVGVFDAEMSILNSKPNSDTIKREQEPVANSLCTGGKKSEITHTCQAETEGYKSSISLRTGNTGKTDADLETDQLAEYSKPETDDKDEIIKEANSVIDKTKPEQVKTCSEPNTKGAVSRPAENRQTEDSQRLLSKKSSEIAAIVQVSKPESIYDTEFKEDTDTRIQNSECSNIKTGQPAAANGLLPDILKSKNVAKQHETELLQLAETKKPAVIETEHIKVDNDELSASTKPELIENEISQTKHESRTLIIAEADQYEADNHLLKKPTKAELAQKTTVSTMVYNSYIKEDSESVKTKRSVLEMNLMTEATKPQSDETNEFKTESGMSIKLSTSGNAEITESMAEDKLFPKTMKSIVLDSHEATKPECAEDDQTETATGFTTSANKCACC